MRAGDLRQQFTILRPDDTTGTARYSPVRTIWGSLSGLSGIESPAIQAKADLRVEVRYTTDLTPRDQLALGSRVFVLESPPVDPDGRRRKLTMLVSEHV